MTDSWQRIGTALLAAPIAIGLTYLGGWYMALLIGVIGGMAQREFYAMAAGAGAPPWRWAGYGLGGLLVVLPLWSGAAPLLVLGVVAVVVAVPFRWPQQALTGLAATLAGAVYPTGLLSALVALRVARGPLMDDLQAFWLTLTTLLVVWATDIFAYYAGRAFGRRALAPRISPNKTWEGSVGGVLAALVVAVGCKLTVLEGLAWTHVAALVVIGGMVSQLGDLAESQMKRSTGLKDTGTALPGHGGFLDRFDAMAAAAPLVYLYLRYVAHLF